MTQEQLAEILYVTPAMVSMYEKKDYNIPSKTVLDIASALGTSAGYLMDGVENTISDEEKELLVIYNSLKGKLKGGALMQMKVLTEI